jgi:DedD protein
MDTALKQRLVGATVLILLAVIVLPMLLSGQSETLQQETARIEVPPRPDELSFESRRFPVGSQANGAPAINRANNQPVEPEYSQPTGTDQPGDTDTAAGDAAELAPTTAEVTTNGSAPTPVPEPGEEEGAPVIVSTSAEGGPGATESATGPGEVEVPDNKQRYLVQVASFSTTANANSLSAKLAASGMPVLMDNVETDAGLLHRVRVGPFDDRQQADEVVRSVAGQFSDLKPRIIDLQPEQNAPVTSPSDPLVRWIVQAGSFNQPENADQLVMRLRQAGFSAYQEKVSDAARTVFKVRIGPEIKRESAVSIAQRIKSEFDIDGLVMSAE